MMNIEQSELEFLVEIQELSLNSSGTFSVVLSLQSSDSEKLTKDVFFEVDDHGKDLGHSTDVGSVEVPHDLVGKAVKFQKKVKFYISKGIFKDDDESSLFLLVDVFKKDDVDVKECSSRVVIFQSPGSLPEPGPEKTITSVTKNILNLTSKLTAEGITIHVGRIICSYSLKANKVEKTPEPTPEPVKEPTPEPVKEPTPEPVEAHRTPSPDSLPQPTLPPPPPLIKQKPEVEDKPKDHVKKTLPKKKGSERYRRHIVSQLGREEVIVHVHAASGLPNLLPDSSPPFPYVAGTTKSDEDAGVSPQQTTSIAKMPTFFPSWEETVVIEIDEVDSDTEEVVLLVNDLTSQSTLMKYQIPVVYLKPFHQYHLDLIQEGVGFETHLYISILHRTCRLQLLDALTYSGVEITLCSLAHKISNLSDPLMAVVRIVPDYYALRKEIESSKYVNELHPHPVHCPARELDFTATNVKHSNPQISLPLSQTGSSWDQQLLFCEPRLMASTFTGTSALVIEYYSTTTAFESGKWYLDQSLGYSTMLLNKHVYNALKSERGRNGIRVENLSLKETSLQTENDHIPAVNLVLRLISEEHPSSLLTASYFGDLPKLEHFAMEAERLPPPRSPSLTPSPPPKKQSSPRIPSPTKTPVQKKIPFRDGETPPPVPLYHNPVVHSPKPRAYKLVLKEDELPPLDAVQNLLPDPHRVILDPDHKYQDHPGLIPTRLPPKDLNDDPPRDPKSKSRQTPPDRYAITLLDHQQRELDNYKTAMKRMGDEIVKLQEEITRLEAVNSKLRQQVNMHEDTTRALLRDSELVDIPRNELVQRYVSLRDKLSSQVREATSYRDKLLQLQNELIRHNDREKEFLNLQDAHFKQSAILQRFQEKQQKIKKLEETCRKQEEVIEKMEKLLKGKVKKGKDEATPKLDAKEAFLAENSRLRSEINQMKNKSQVKEVSFDDAERMELYSKLDRSDGRIRTLERAVRENARKWGQEKEELLLRLNEQNHRASLPPVNRSYYRYDDDDDFEDRLFPKHRTRLRPRGRYGSPRLEPLM